MDMQNTHTLTVKIASQNFWLKFCKRFVTFQFWQTVRRVENIGFYRWLTFNLVLLRKKFDIYSLTCLVLCVCSFYDGSAYCYGQHPLVCCRTFQLFLLVLPQFRLNNSNALLLEMTKTCLGFWSICMLYHAIQIK